jgi:hypothetical protein
MVFEVLFAAKLGTECITSSRHRFVTFFFVIFAELSFRCVARTKFLSVHCVVVTIRKLNAPLRDRTTVLDRSMRQFAVPSKEAPAA